MRGGLRRRLLRGVAVLGGAVTLALAIAPHQAAAATCNNYAKVPWGASNLYGFFPTSSSGDLGCTLRRGDTGAAVFILQGNLNDCYASHKVTGTYGQKTEDIIRWIQATRGLQVDGIYGLQTALFGGKIWGIYSTKNGVNEVRGCGNAGDWNW